MAGDDHQTKLFNHLKKWLEMAIMDYQMIEKGDRVLVGVSGGADSLALLDLLHSPMVRVPAFTLLAVNIDPGFDKEYQGYARLEKYLQSRAYDYVMEKTDNGPLAHSSFNRKNPCFLCSRFLLKELERENKNIHGNIWKARQHVKPDYLPKILR